MVSVCVPKPALAEGGFFVATAHGRTNSATVTKQEPDEPVAIPITGELDLHTFRPPEIPSLLDSYFHECRRRGLDRVRIVHGKGSGTLRAIVHAHLHRCAMVAGFVQGDEHTGGWGATIVTLKRGDSS